MRRPDICTRGPTSTAEINEKESTRQDDDAQELMEEMSATESEARRMDTMRKGKEQKRAPKRRKMDWLDWVRQEEKSPALRKI